MSLELVAKLRFIWLPGNHFLDAFIPILYSISHIFLLPQLLILGLFLHLLFFQVFLFLFLKNSVCFLYSPVVVKLIFINDKKRQTTHTHTQNEGWKTKVKIMPSILHVDQTRRSNKIIYILHATFF